MFAMLGICLTLTGLLVINSLGSFAAALVWRLISRQVGSWSACARAQILFLLRVFPPAIAVLSVGVLFMPFYLVHEPRETDEVVTAELGVLAAASLFAIGTVLWRALSSWLLTRRLMKNWLRHSEPIEIENATIPAYCIRHPFPLIAIVGTMRPKLFVAEQVIQSLTPGELAASIAHEHGHLAAADNLKRGLMRICRDSLLIRTLGHTLDRAWTAAVELAADEHAARTGADAALDLASALVKVARLVPENAKPAMFAGAFLMASETGGIQRRVQKLTQLATQTGSLKPQRHVSVGKLAACASAFFLMIFFIALSTGHSFTIHSALEFIVALLQ